MSIDDLIARLEAATQGNRELDAWLDAAIHGRDVVRVEGDFSLETWHTPGRYWYDAVHFADPPNYTTSIDTALRLLPEWASFELQQSASGPPTFTRCRLLDWHRSPTGFDPGNEWKCEGNRPLSINICVAALRARAATDKDKSDRSQT